MNVIKAQKIYKWAVHRIIVWIRMPWVNFLGSKILGKYKKKRRQQMNNQACFAIWHQKTVSKAKLLNLV